MPFDHPGSNIYAGGGHAIVRGGGTMHLYRLGPTPAHVMEIPAPHGTGWRADALYMGPDRMALAPEVLDPRGGTSGEYLTVMFVRSDELAP